jgi:RHS repeat-associated protein
VVTDYLFGDGIDEPLVARSEVGVKTYFAAHGLGSIVAGVDSTGAIVQAQAYNAWGAVTKGGTSYSFGYTGREPGPATLLHYRARYYEPGTGRFLSEDLIPRPDGAAYGYANGDPVSFKDPLGLDAGGAECGPVGCIARAIRQYDFDRARCVAEQVMSRASIEVRLHRCLTKLSPFKRNPHVCWENAKSERADLDRRHAVCLENARYNYVKRVKKCRCDVVGRGCE